MDKTYKRSVYKKVKTQKSTHMGFPSYKTEEQMTEVKVSATFEGVSGG